MAGVGLVRIGLKTERKRKLTWHDHGLTTHDEDGFHGTKVPDA